MLVVTSDLIQNKKVLLRLDFDIPLEDGRIVDDFRLKAALPTLKLCLESANSVVVMGHLGRPHFAKASRGKPGEFFDHALSVEPVYDWFWEIGGIREFIENGKLRFLENLRFELGEESCDLEYARQLAFLGDIYVNEAFAAYHPAASTTILPTLLPHVAGLHFAEEVRVLTSVREAPRRGLVAIIGGAKVEDKLPAVLEMSKIADYVLVGGKLVEELKNIDDGRLKMEGSILKMEGREIDKTINLQPSTIKKPSSTIYPLPSNILLGTLNKEGTDLTEESVMSWKEIIDKAKMIVWNGPVGKIEDLGFKNEDLRENDLGSAKGTYDLAQMIINSKAEAIVGGGDTTGFLDKLGLLEKFFFVSTGGGAMLEFLETGTLPTIEALA